MTTMKQGILGALLLAVWLAFGVGCGAEDGSSGGAEPMENVDDPVLDGKSDSLAKLVIKGEIAFGQEIADAFDKSKLHGYTFTGLEGAAISLGLTGDPAQKTDTVVMLYGPKVGSSWGAKPIAKDDDGAGSKFSALSGVVLPADGEYLILATCKNTKFKGKTYEVRLDCDAGSCAGAAQAEWTALVYGSFDTHDDGGIPSSLKDMAQKIGTDNAKVNLLYLEDKPEGPNTKLYKVGFRKVEVVRDYGELLLGTPQTLTQVIQYVRDKYPSKRFFLNLIGHTSSGAAAFLPDYFPKATSWKDERMMYWQVRQAILDSGVKPDVLGLSGCGTAELEIAARMSDVASFTVGLQEYNQGYTDVRWADSLEKNPAIDGKGLARRVAEGEFKKGYYDQGSPGATGAVDTSKLAAVKTAFTALNAAMMAKMETNGHEFAEARKSALQMQSGGFQFYVDAYDFAEQLALSTTDADVQEKAEAFRAALATALVGGGAPNYADEADHANAHGINLVFVKPFLTGRIVDPSDYDDELSAWPKEQTSFYEETGWVDVVTALYPLLK